MLEGFWKERSITVYTIPERDYQSGMLIFIWHIVPLQRDICMECRGLFSVWWGIGVLIQSKIGNLKGVD